MAAPKLLSSMDIEITLSQRLYDLIGGQNEKGQMRVWSSMAKAALSFELEKHHRTRIPKHFARSARGVYGYKNRSVVYRAIKSKVYHSQTDLVKTGATANQMIRSYQIRMSGSALSDKSGGMTYGSLIMRFPFPVNRDNTKPGRIKIEEMKKEIASTTPTEQNEISTGFGMRMQRYFEAYQGGQRVFRRFGYKPKP